jgi:hypothetical protein
MTQETTAENADILARITAAKERTEKAQRRQDATRDELTSKLEAAELEAADAEAIATACEKLGERGKHFGTVPTPLGVVILQKPNPLKYKQFQDANKFTTTALEALVYQCRFSPDAGRLQQIFTEYPGKIAECADCVADLAKGARKDAEGKS